MASTFWTVLLLIGIRCQRKAMGTNWLRLCQHQGKPQRKHPASLCELRSFRECASPNAAAAHVMGQAPALANCRGSPAAPSATRFGAAHSTRAPLGINYTACSPRAVRHVAVEHRGSRQVADNATWLREVRLKHPANVASPRRVPSRTIASHRPASAVPRQQLLWGLRCCGRCCVGCDGEAPRGFFPRATRDGCCAVRTGGARLPVRVVAGVVSRVESLNRVDALHQRLSLPTLLQRHVLEAGWSTRGGGSLAVASSRSRSFSFVGRNWSPHRPALRVRPVHAA